MQDFKIIDEKNNYTQFLDNQVMVMFKTSISIDKDSIGNYLNMIFLFDKIQTLISTITKIIRSFNFTYEKPNFFHYSSYIPFKFAEYNKRKGNVKKSKSI